MQRVVSKNLFNFPLKGEYDDDVLAMETQKQELSNSDEAMTIKTKIQEQMFLDDENSNLQFAKHLRLAMGQNLRLASGHETLKKAMDEIVETEIWVPTAHDGKYDVQVHIYTPKYMKCKYMHGSKNPCYIYAHGGGAVACTAKDFKPFLSYLAINCEIVIFNVDYRKAPETKCPNNVKDFYEAVKYVSNHATKLSVDKTKISIGGDSGGGYICLATEVLLAQRNESNLVKLAIPGIPMVDDYLFSDTQAMTKEEQNEALMMRKIWKCIAMDLDAQKNDPLLFPGKASDEILENFPPTIINEVEFDMFITEATRLANRLRRAGKLLEFIIIPGAIHGAGLVQDLKCSKLFNESMKTVFREYLHN